MTSANFTNRKGALHVCKGTSDGRSQKLLKYKTKNEMVPTFFSGIFLSAAINILTTATFRNNCFEILSMSLMFFSCGMFFWEATKIHQLQTWYNSLPAPNKKDDYFLENTEIWNLGSVKKFYKKTLPYFPVVAWITGILSLLLFLFSVCIEEVTVKSCEFIYNKK